jgi:hypothetical protein
MIELTVEQSKVVKLGKLLKKESDGAKLKRDLGVNIRAAVEPGVAAVKSKLQAIPRSGPSKNPPLGGYLAARVKVRLRFTGRSAGVAVRIQQTPNLRGFKMAARRLNRTQWRHPVYGNKENWATQISPIPGYFDETLSKYKAEYTAAVLAACRKMAMRLGERL